MTKSKIAVLLLTLTVNSANADELDIGGTRIEAPAPSGFTRLTPDIQPLYDVSMDMLSPTNVRLATFIDEAVIPDARAGQMPVFERYINVETTHGLVSQMVTAREFAQLRRDSRDQLEEAFEDMEENFPRIMDTISDDVGETLDLDFAISINNIVPLPVHAESDSVLANSMILKFDVSGEGEVQHQIATATNSIVFLKGKVFFVYVYGGQDDLEWTRTMAAEWTGRIVDANPASSGESRSSEDAGRSGMDWERVFDKAVVGMLVGGAIGLVFGLFGWIRGRNR